MYKVAVLGAMGCGKTALTVRFVSGQFVEECDQTIENFYWKDLSLDGHQTKLEILDAAGTECLTATGDLYIKECDGFLLVYSITDAQPLIDLLARKCDITKGRLSKVIVLVGNKCDVEENRNVATRDGEMLAREWGCPFFETSAKTGYNTEEAFQELVREIIRRQRPLCTSIQEGDTCDTAVDNSAVVQQVNERGSSNKSCCCVCF